MLNSNIRCIEMIDPKHPGWAATRLNSNIRCIEMVKHKMAVEHFLVE